MLTFLIAARAVGVTAPVSRLLPLAFLSMMAMVLPNIGGWGPREGVTAWAFSAAGLGAGRGAATAVAYGVMVLAASLPGGLVLLSGCLAQRRGRAPRRSSALASPKSSRRENVMNTSETTIRSESRLAIASSVPEVWAYICDVGRWPQWAPTVGECWVHGGGPLVPGARVEQRAKLIFGTTRYRAQHVTTVEAPRSLAFAGPMGTSAARWGMEFAPIDGGQTEAEMWVEVDLTNVMRALPSRALKGRIQRVMDIEMAAIKAAVESRAPSRARIPKGESRRNGMRSRSTP